MGYELILLQRSSAGAGVEMLGTTESPEIIARIRGLLAAQPNQPMQINTTKKAGPKGRKVYVKSVEDENTTSLRAGDILESASELSAMLGSKYKVVSVQLKAAKSRQEDSATVNGVEFCFLDELAGRVG